MTARELEQWLDSPPDGWDVDEMPGWLARGRQLGPEVLPRLRALRYQRLPLLRTQAVRMALYQFAVDGEAEFYPYFWVNHARAARPDQVKRLPPQTRGVLLAPPPKTTDFGGFAAPLASVKSLESVQVDSGHPKGLDFLAALPKLKNVELPNMRQAPLDFAAADQLTALKFLRAGPAKHANLDRLGALTELRSLTLGTPTELNFLGSLSDLAYLKLSTFDHDELSDLAGLSRLQCLVVENGKKLTDLDSFPDSLPALTTLRVRLSWNLTELSAVRNFHALREVELTELRKLRSFAGLSDLPNVRELFVGMCRQVEDVEAVGTMTTLTDLRLTDMGKFESLDFLANLTNLRHLDLTATAIGNKSYEPLFDLQNLITLYVWEYKDKQVEELRRRLPHTMVCGNEAYANSPAGAEE